MTDFTPLRDDPEITDEAPRVDAAPRVGASPSADPRVRLYRRRNHRVIAGVAGGLSDRFDIDPNIIRVVFVVLSALFGLGVVLYLALWAFVPRAATVDGDEVHPAEPTRSWLAFVLLLAVVVVGLLFVATTEGLPRFGGGLVVVWLLFLIGISVVSIRVASPRLTFQRFLALIALVALTVVIVMVGGFLAFLASTNVPLSGGDGQHSWQPTSLRSVAHDYQTEFGSETVNLADVVFPKSGYVVSASVAVGTLTVYVPTDAVVDLRTHVGVGTITYNNVDSADLGFNPLPPGAETTAERTAAPHLTLTVAVGAGTISVARQSPGTAGS